MAKALGLKKSKLFRFLERESISPYPGLWAAADKRIEGYAVVYFGIMGTVGLVSCHPCTLEHEVRGVC